ncbi:MAG: ligase-associated DNA damage response endonuclease PdeM [Planctomyces sp.]|nr:ligase-associated DNA damage response endonuclease PdeM [Planctomyces sp.]
MSFSAAKPTSTQVELAGAVFTLLPQHAVWWPEKKSVFVADTHFGKEATFRSASIPVPDQTLQQLQRLNDVLNLTQASRLIILGDLLHSRRGRCELTFERISMWRQLQANLDVVVVRGNHDRHAGSPPADWHFRCVEPPFPDGGLSLFHEPPSETDNALQPRSGLAGHLHPAIRLKGPARDSVRLPCFLLRRGVLILPAFSPFVDHKIQQLEQGDRVFAIAEDAVIQVS